MIESLNAAKAAAALVG